MTPIHLPRIDAVVVIARTIALAMVVALLQGCASGDPVKVVNHSATELTNVVVSGSGFSQSFGTIPPGGAETLRVRPRGETGLRIVFEANGRSYSSAREALQDDHLERAEITIGADHSILIQFNPP